LNSFHNKFIQSFSLLQLFTSSNCTPAFPSATHYSNISDPRGNTIFIAPATIFIASATIFTRQLNAQGRFRRSQDLSAELRHNRAVRSASRAGR